jgi:short-subunit dehydrogenase
MGNNKKYVLITGATSGIGYELPKLFAQNEYNLVIVARTEANLAKVAQEFHQQYHAEVVPIAKDLFLPDAAEEVYEEVKRRGIQIDVLVNDAGQGQFGEFVDTDIHREFNIIQLNILAPLMLTKLFLKEMVERKEGKILNIGSIAGETPGPLNSIYHGTKAFINNWSEAIRDEVKDKGVTVTVLLPGVTATDFANKADMANTRLFQDMDNLDAAKVAKDGYEALMAGDDKIVSGLKYKAMVAMSHITPDSVLAKEMHILQSPVDNNEAGEDKDK